MTEREHEQLRDTIEEADREQLHDIRQYRRAQQRKASVTFENGKWVARVRVLGGPVTEYETPDRADAEAALARMVGR